MRATVCILRCVQMVWEIGVKSSSPKGATEHSNKSCHGFNNRGQGWVGGADGWRMHLGRLVHLTRSRQECAVYV